MLNGVRDFCGKSHGKGCIIIFRDLSPSAIDDIMLEVAKNTLKIDQRKFSRKKKQKKTKKNLI